MGRRHTGGTGTTTGGGPSGPRRVAVIGSSGGNLRSQGGDDPARLIGEIQRQLAAAGFQLVTVQFVAAQASMDSAGDSTPAQLWELSGGRPVPTVSGTLAEVNEAARTRDSILAERVEVGQVDALVLVSADPTGTNSATVTAAAAAGIPAAGTGGTSIARAESAGLNLVSVSGTTGTTSTTRAVAYVSGLARHWKVRYRPVLGHPPVEVPDAGVPGPGSDQRGTSGTGTAHEGDPFSPTGEDAGTHDAAWRRISIRGIMVGSIPAFIALALVLAASKIPVLSGLGEVFDVLIAGLPIVVAAVAARKVSALDEVGMVAGAVAGILASKGGLLGGLAAGILAGLLASWLIRWTLSHRFPATTANIVAGGLAGLLPGLLVYYLLAPATNWLGEAVKTGIQAALDFSPVLAGALAGGVIWFALMGGVYHSVILPLVLLEMGQKGFSFFGAIDMVCLVMVSLGITLANVVRPRSSGERALAGSGAAVNFFFGTFVEASYPFMFSDRRVFATAIGAATVGGAVVGAMGVEATAYLPAVMAPFVATNALGMVIAMLVATGLSFTATLLINMSATRRTRTSEVAGVPA
ncbi:hypothetical protein [Actinomyces provencensis]|uniref:hypothetical protein n=1 Tax=Actinomyces provencensis TaxID=1720198 RepID=UPI00096A6426|nr:hypothetical protein [Actinomyces provencensis]